MDDVGETAGEVGLWQVVDAFVQALVCGKEFAAVAAGVDDFQFGITGKAVTGDIESTGLARHDHVGKENIHAVFDLGPHCNGRVAVFGFDDAVVVAFQNLDNKGSHMRRLRLRRWCECRRRTRIRQLRE